jgi:hypothetical protein
VTFADISRPKYSAPRSDFTLARRRFGSDRALLKSANINLKHDAPDVVLLSSGAICDNKMLQGLMSRWTTLCSLTHNIPHNNCDAKSFCTVAVSRARPLLRCKYWVNVKSASSTAMTVCLRAQAGAYTASMWMMLGCCKPRKISISSAPE